MGRGGTATRPPKVSRAQSVAGVAAEASGSHACRHWPTCSSRLVSFPRRTCIFTNEQRSNILKSVNPNVHLPNYDHSDCLHGLQIITLYNKHGYMPWFILRSVYLWCKKLQCVTLDFTLCRSALALIRSWYANIISEAFLSREDLVYCTLQGGEKQEAKRMQR